MSQSSCQTLSSHSRREFSPDIFSDSSFEPSQNICTDNEEFETTSPENSSWKGSSIDELYNGKGPWGWEVVSIVPSTNHKVSFQLPLPIEGSPIPCRFFPQYCWDQDHVRMPFSNRNLYPVEKSNGRTELIQRWNLIQAALSRPISNVFELEKAILSYNGKYGGRSEFQALRHFFNSIEHEEREHFFTFVLPKIKKLVLALPKLLPSSVSLLKKGKTCAVSLGQNQIASLLANAFFCTFTRRSVSHKRNEYILYPQINFDSLYRARTITDQGDPTSEKLKCLFNYFRRVTNEVPDGVVTFQRQYLAQDRLPTWDKPELNFSSVRLHVTNSGTIDENGQGFLQVDFANKYVGGGVLGYGCVQEEIRFAVCPELIVARLFTEELGPTEALIVTGVEQYNTTEGYADTFKWIRDFKDTTPRDLFRRRKCQLVAIDALRFTRPEEQFLPHNMIRDLNKAYVGFYSPFENMSLQPVATGNWGCGAFRGDPYLKSLLQLMACCMARRDLVYFTFQNIKLRDTLYNMYKFLIENNVTIAQLWRCLRMFSNENVSSHKLYPFLFQVLQENKVTKKSIVTQRFKKNKNVDTDCERDSDTSKNNSTNSVLLSEHEDESKGLTDQSNEIAMELEQSKIVVSDLSKFELTPCDTKAVICDKGICNKQVEKQIDCNVSGSSEKIKIQEVTKKSPRESATKRKITDYFVNIAEQ